MGNTYCRLEREFDEKKNTVKETYYDGAGAPIACNEGYDELRQVFDEKNRLIRQEFYAGGALVLNNKKIAALEREYDENNLVATERYYGVNGERVKSTDGYSRIDRTWLDKDHVISQFWYDENDQPIAVGNTYCRPSVSSMKRRIR